MKMFNILIIKKKLENSLQLIQTELPSVKYWSIVGTILISVIYHKWTASCLSHQGIFRGTRYYISGNTPSHIFP
jgi:hypothetical protein